MNIVVAAVLVIVFSVNLWIQIDLNNEIRRSKELRKEINAYRTNNE